MDVKEITTIQFVDADSGGEALMIVRAQVQGGLIGLALSLLDNGDIEVFFGITECKRLVEALQEAELAAGKQPT
jgi:hypothetical protein